MALRVARFLSLVFLALCLVPASAHLLELPHKIGMSRDEYLVAQSLYRGWALLGVVVVAALGATLVTALLQRHRRVGYRLALAAFFCLVAAQLVFWIFTFPANRVTENWTRLPADWAYWRARWELSHAAGALFVFAGFVSEALAVVRDDGRAPSGAAI